MQLRNFTALIGGLLLFLLLLAACDSSNNQGIDLVVETRDVPAPTAQNPTSEEIVYPGVTDNGYPGASNVAPTIDLADILTELPAGVDLPQSDPNTGTIGGILVREITDQGFLPVTPYELILATPLYGTSGTLTYVRHSETSQRAELLPTGIFIFKNVPPGEYAFVADLVVSQQTLRDANGDPLFVTIEANQALDLGAIMVELAVPEE